MIPLTVSTYLNWTGHGLSSRAGLEFLTGKLFTGQDIRGSDKTYDDLKAAYQTAILAKGRFFTDDSFLHTFEYYDSDRGISLGGRSGKPR